MGRFGGGWVSQISVPLNHCISMSEISFNSTEEIEEDILDF